MHTAALSSSAKGSSPATGPSIAEASFAGLLAAQTREAPWNDDELRDDVATLSYEQALRNHRAMRPEPGPVPADARGAGSSCKDLQLPASQPAALKNASITIRLSEAECAQLRQRASEAGLTVSAYLRSCTLEVESLRTQVKEALAELRKAPQPHDAPIQESKLEPEHRLQSVLDRIRSWLGAIVPARKKVMGLNPANPFAPYSDKPFQV